QYNSRGHLIKQTDCGSDNSKPPIVTTYQRNAVGQVISKTNQDGTTAFAYDQQGRLSAATNAHRQLRWQYNPLGQIVAEWQDQHVINYHYNAAGQCSHMQLPNRHIIECHYNRANQLQGLCWLRRGEPIKHEQLLSVQYHRDGRERLRDHGNGLRTLSRYTPQGRLQAQGIFNYRFNNTVDNKVNNSEPRKRPEDQLLDELFGRADAGYTGLQTTHYRYSPGGQLTEIDDSFRGHTHYHYDALDRLTQVEGAAPEYLIHDPAHNLLASASTQAAAAALAAQSQVSHNRLQVQGHRRFHLE
ncbi:MAG: RHS repeat protein, partial [Cellvibrionaceae bacterium]|nr:RHS repeat protein [Cellvibrionaceae bacterium]